MEKQTKAKIKKRNGKYIVSCPLCPLSFIASTEKQAEANFNMHYIHRHNSWEEEDG